MLWNFISFAPPVLQNVENFCANQLPKLSYFSTHPCLLSVSWEVCEPTQMCNINEKHKSSTCCPRAQCVLGESRQCKHPGHPLIAGPPGEWTWAVSTHKALALTVTYDLNKCPYLNLCRPESSFTSLPEQTGGKEDFVQMSLIMPILHCLESNAFLVIFFN